MKITFRNAESEFLFDFGPQLCPHDFFGHRLWCMKFSENDSKLRLLGSFFFDFFRLLLTTPTTLWKILYIYIYKYDFFILMMYRNNMKYVWNKFMDRKHYVFWSKETGSSNLIFSFRNSTFYFSWSRLSTPSPRFQFFRPFSNPASGQNKLSKKDSMFALL